MQNAFFLIIIALILPGCARVNHVQDQRGTLTGGSQAAVPGVIDGADSGSTARRAIIGAVAGGVPGSIIGRQMDQQVKEIEKLVAGATVERVGEGIEVTFASALLYDAGADQLRPAGEQNLRDLAKTFDRYRDTDLLIVAHTEFVGSERYNQELSERRARSVRDFLVMQGVPVDRLHSTGRGGREPLHATVTNDGRHPNQRIEVAIFASPSYRNELSKQRYTR
jgi:outer membrane protein OmpA-like peptidoglycan-associated protein